MLSSACLYYCNNPEYIKFYMEKRHDSMNNASRSCQRDFMSGVHGPPSSRVINRTC